MKQLFAFLLSCILSINFLNIGNMKVSADNISADEFLISTGMSQEQIDDLDTDIKEYIVNNLKSNAVIEDLEFVELKQAITITPFVNQVLTGINFQVVAYKDSGTIYIYPSYEFTTDKKPSGNDSFSFQLGDAMRPFNYGGQLWYKDNVTTDWTLVDSLVANNQGFNGAEYSGSQLGTPVYSMKLKGCAYCYANIGEGTDKRIIMSYLYNPNKYSYSISFAAYGLGITYNSSSTVYTAASTVVLNY